MSPVVIEMMLKAYYLGGGLPEDAGEQSPAAREGIQQLENAGLIEKDSLKVGWHATERGRVYVGMLENTPLPVKEWVDPRGEEE